MRINQYLSKNKQNEYIVVVCGTNFQVISNIVYLEAILFLSGELRIKLAEVRILEVDPMQSINTPVQTKNL